MSKIKGTVVVIGHWFISIKIEYYKEVSQQRNTTGWESKAFVWSLHQWAAIFTTKGTIVTKYLKDCKNDNILFKANTNNDT